MSHTQNNHSTPYTDINRARKIAHTRTQNKHLQDKNIYDQRHKQPHFEVGDLVLVKLYHHPNTGKLAPYFTGPHTVLEIISPNVVRIDRPNQPLQRDNDTINVNKLKLYTETIRYISPPAVRICHIKHKPNYPFPSKHLTPELFPADPLRFKPTNSEPFRNLDPAIFATRRFAPFFPDIKNCEPDNQFNHNTPLPKDSKQCEIERSTMNKVRTNISESPFTTIWKNMFRYPIFHLIFILCLLVLPYNYFDTFQDIVSVNVYSESLLKEVERHDITFTTDDAKDHHGSRIFSVHHDSIIPATAQFKQESDYKPYAANGSEIITFGVKILNLDLGLRRDFQWPFIIANVKRGILGAEFLFKYNFLVDINKRKLIDGLTNLEIICEAISTFEGSITTVKANSTFNLIAQFPDITKPLLSQTLDLRFSSETRKASPRQLQQLHFISQFSTEICHISGQDNVVADTLSRIEELTLIDYDVIADEQILDSELNNLQTNVQTSLKFKQYPLPSGKQFWCNTSTANIRPYLPNSHRMRMFHQIHGLSHPRIRSTIKPSIRKDVLQWSRDCGACQRNKINRHTKNIFGTFQMSTEKFNDIHIDLVGPLPPSNNYIYCLTCIDRYSNWMEAIPFENNSADTVARALYNNRITRYGTPLRLVTDRGAQFTSDTFANLTKICGIKLQHTTAYHP
ncbi:hypothetical protein LAZ67_5002702 [Cordylochernes scorpioides]|uniref:Integrase catalytic domain-containing protein n=1 Tax=Cordylochernes scorpioides TaxID=51811 RepID=A0ABY6KGW3_9ARAC|nr:hypothetical protein LAZ67_5002702 [Cordylochernes scorpioides]